MTGPAWFKDQCQPKTVVGELRLIAMGLVNWMGVAAASRRLCAAADAVERALAEKDARIQELLEANTREVERRREAEAKAAGRAFAERYSGTMAALARDGHPSFGEELARAGSLADSCYRHEVYRPMVLGPEVEEAV